MEAKIPDIENPDQIEAVANWIELYLCLKNPSLSKSTLSGLLEESLGYEPEEPFIDDIFREMEFRKFLYGENAPFIIESNIVSMNIDWKDNPHYLLCVFLGLYGNNFQTQKTGVLFELISEIAIKNYLGGETILTGFPNKKSVSDICKVIEEKFVSEPTSNFKDRGVDLIAWKNFYDKRTGKIWGVFQCASGNNWKDKLSKIPLNAWRQYIHTANTFPFTGFTTSQLISNEEEFYNSVVECGVLLDRPRIYKYSFNNLQTQLKGDILTWCENRINNL